MRSNDTTIPERGNSLRGKGGDMAEIERLKRVLDSIPAKGAINLARRRAILQQIYALMEET